MVSVCIATFNGEKYIAEQLTSILRQLGPGDEVILSDDSSTDGTLEVAKSLGDSRVKVFPEQTFRNPAKNFEFALSRASGDYVFLSDQDDIWAEDKVERFTDALVAGASLVLSNCRVIDSKGDVTAESFFLLNRSGRGFWRNLLKNSYLGCCMAMRRDLVSKALPFPKQVPMHDWWIGLVAERTGMVAHLETPLLDYRRHGGNASAASERSKVPLMKRLWWRAYLLWKVLVR